MYGDQCGEFVSRFWACKGLERFSYDLEMKTREQNRKNKRTEIERFDWFIEWIQTQVAFGWLIEHSGKKNFMPENFLEINRYFAFTSYCNQLQHDWPIDQCLLHIRFFWRENEKAMFWSFHPLADKTNNKQLLKPFFKVMRKSLC